MKKLFYIAIGVLWFLAPLAFAQAASISIQALSPGATLLANTRLTFSIVASGFFPETYRLSDSYNGTSITVSDINPSGNVSWVPSPSDVGTHTLTITALDEAGDSASATQVITVSPPPSVSIGPLSPGPVVLPGKTLTFSVSTTGFTNPSYFVGDEFGGSSLTDSDISAAGNFSWTPDTTQNGQHTISIYASDSLGHSASASQAVQVGAGPTLFAQVTSSSTSAYPGQPVSIVVSGNNFAPTSFGVSDNFPHTTVIGGYMTTLGSVGTFVWTPQLADIGTHILAFTGTIGSYGQSATTSTTITVLSPAGYVPPASVATPAATPAPTVSAPVQTPATSAGFSFTTTLYSGMQGAAVTQLQTLLAQKGFFSATPNGYFGPLTASAVEKFQAANGLEQLGVVGPATRAALNVLLTGSSTAPSTAAPASAAGTGDGYVFNNFMGFGEDTADGSDVLELQKRLAILGYFSAATSGYFGSVTEQAVEQFQTAHGIPATGYVGSATRAALNQ